MLSASLLGGAMRIASRESMRLHPTEPGFRLPPPDPARAYLLYVHVPFCPVLCPFCSFHRVALREAKARRYFPALHRQIEGYAAAGFRLSGVYVGGGTPTATPLALFELLSRIRARFGVVPISVETNPDDLKPEILEPLRAAGVSRLSVGIQSFDDALLRSMGRYEKYGSGDAIRGRLARVAGQFATLNVDLIFNLPGQTHASLERDLGILRGDGSADQVSYYPLMVTAATRRAMSGRMGDPTFRREHEFYRMIRERLADTYAPATAWCFSKRAAAIDEYIVTDDEYLGAGSGAFGYLDGMFYANTFSLNGYGALANRAGGPVTMYRQMTLRERMRYDLLTRLFGLRLDRTAIEAKYHGRFERNLWLELAALRALGAVTRDPGGWSVTERGMYLWVVLMREFLGGVNRFRDQLRLNIQRESIAGVFDGRKSPAMPAL
jgi:coproporphyrinogen III oxidase-like Fe-S oxidoreductase